MDTMDKMATVDLHMHSAFSDGKLAPSILVETAVRKGLSAIALTDHDCVDGFPEFAAAAEEAGIDSLAGVELSCVHDGCDVHVLGYGVATDDAGLRDALRQFCDTRERRAERIVEKLADLGVHVDMERIRARAGDGAIGRPHIAEAIVEGKYAKDFGEVFARYIGEDGPAYVEKYKMTPNEAVTQIHAAGGVAFVAHPGHYLSEPEIFDAILAEGFDGIEVHHPQHRPPVIEKLLDLAQSRQLMVSGGSDFHGFAGRDNMGIPVVPRRLYDEIVSRIARRAA